MYLYNNKQYESEFSARWAAFFEKLGIEFDYVEDAPERFILNKMKIVALVTERNEAKEIEASTWLKTNNVPRIDVSKFGSPKEISIALLRGNPWKSDGVCPLGTVYGKSRPAPELMTADGRQTGFFLNIMGFPALAVEHIKGKVHCGGYLISAGDLVRVLTEEDRTNWQNAAVYARDVSIEPVMPGISLLKSFDLADKQDEDNDDPLSDFEKNLHTKNISDSNGNNPSAFTGPFGPMETVESNGTEPKYDSIPIVNSETESGIIKSTPKPDEERSDFFPPDPDVTTSVFENRENIEEEPDNVIKKNTTTVEELGEDDEPSFDTDIAEDEPPVTEGLRETTLTKEELKNVASEAEENLNTIREEDKVKGELPEQVSGGEKKTTLNEADESEERHSKAKNFLNKFFFEEDEEEVSDSKKKNPAADTSPLTRTGTSVPDDPEEVETTESLDTEENHEEKVILKANDPSAPHGEEKKALTTNWVKAHYDPIDTVFHDVNMDNLLEDASRDLGVEVTHDELLWCMLKSEFPYQQLNGREYFGAKKK